MILDFWSDVWGSRYLIYKIYPSFLSKYMVHCIIEKHAALLNAALLQRIKFSTVLLQRHLIYLNNFIWINIFIRKKQKHGKRTEKEYSQRCIKERHYKPAL